MCVYEVGVRVVCHTTFAFGRVRVWVCAFVIVSEIACVRVRLRVAGRASVGLHRDEVVDSVVDVGADAGVTVGRGC